MIRIIKLGNLIYENIEPKTIDENGNEIWNVPNTVPELQTALSDTLVWLEKERVNNILDQYQYNGLADVQFYANQATPDTEAQAILNWYQAYDDAIWNYIDNDLQNITNLDDLLALDIKAVEEQIFQNSIQTASLP